MENLHKSSFDNLPILKELTLLNAGIRRLPKNIFNKQTRLVTLNLTSNIFGSLSDIEPGALPLVCMKSFFYLHLTDNRIGHITKDSTKALKCVSQLNLELNQISFIEEGAFNDLELLVAISLSSNRLTSIKAAHFNFLPNIYFYKIELRNNNISVVEEGSFNLSELIILDLRYNNIPNAPMSPFANRNINQLYLGHNKIKHLPDSKLERKKSKLLFLDFSNNNVATLGYNVLRGMKSLVLLTAVKTGLHKIEDMAFETVKSMGYLFFDDNSLTTITNQTFFGAKYMMYLTLSGNPIKTLEDGAFSGMRDLIAIYLIGTNLRVIDLGTTFVSEQLHIALSTGKNLLGIELTFIGNILMRSSGYWCLKSDTAFAFCFPCDQGEYKIQAFNALGCQKCPPGGFYQDKIAHVGEIAHGLGCKQCPFGTYVSPDKAPGRSEASCSACPGGNDLDKFAGFRACFCLDNYYRLDRFGSCIQCPLGYQCTNETVNLLPGFYWIWNQDSDKEAYLIFKEKIQVENKHRDLRWRNFNKSLPNAYLCPFIGSCKGGFDSKCSNGYEGTLCAVCSKGFYKMYSGCNKCPSVYLFVGQCVSVLIVLGVIVFIIVKDKKSNRLKGRSVTDTIFSSLKIIIGFYQVTSGTLRAYSYIQWPSALTKLMKFADVVQLNIFKLVPIECLRNSLKITPYTGLVIYVSLNALVILFAIGYFYVKMMYLRRNFTNKQEQENKLSTCKANCYRAVFLFLFITYPATCEKVFQVLPVGCAKVCDNQQVCKWYLRSDYSLQCYTSIYNKFVILAYLALVIPIVFPVVTVILLWKYCRNKDDIDRYKNEDNLPLDISKNKANKNYLKKGSKEIKIGMRFIYENYSTDCWYWEVIELIRKVLLTSVLVYSGQQGRLFLGISAIMSGFYAVYFAHSKPIPHTFEHCLHLGSLMATLANQLIGMLLKIPTETVSTMVNEEDDDFGISVLLIFANVLLIVMIAARYLYGLVVSLKTVKDNPKCSVDCIMTVLEAVTITSADGQDGIISVKKRLNRNHNNDNN